jgi:hypothetical protein
MAEPMAAPIRVPFVLWPMACPNTAPTTAPPAAPKMPPCSLFVIVPVSAQLAKSNMQQSKTEIATLFILFPFQKLFYVTFDIFYEISNLTEGV